jgi:hypothetical protein
MGQLEEAKLDASELQRMLESHLLIYDEALVANAMQPFFRTRPIGDANRTEPNRLDSQPDL